MRGPSADGLDADRTRPCVTIEDARTLDARCQDVEQRLAQLVRSRAETLPRRCVQTSPLIATRNHPHKPRRPSAHFNQAELLLPSLLDKLQEIAGEATFTDERSCLAMRRLHDVAVAHEV